VIHRPVEHGGDAETADVAREKGPPPDAMASDMEFDVVLVDGGNLWLQARRRRWWSFWRSWQKMGFACREKLAIKGVKPNKLIPFQ
jgi:hypothetical protein